MMKKLLYVGIVASIMMGCTMSPEKKAESIVANAVKDVLYHPETYDPIGTVVDSAFAPLDAPEFYETTLRLYELSADIQECEQDMKRAQSSMALWSHPYDAFSRNEYNEAKEKYDTYAARLESLQEKGEKLGEELRNMIEQGRYFIGWKVTHGYRAQNNAGQVLIGECEFILTPDMGQILAGYNTSDEEYKTVHACYEAMLENAAE